MNQSHAILRALIAMAIVATLSGFAAPATTGPELTVHRQEGAVYVSFDMHAQDYDEFDARLARDAASVSWTIELYRSARLGFDRMLARAMVRASARRLEDGTFVVSRVVNGQRVDSDVRVDLAGAHAWLTSFRDLRLFEPYQLAQHADHRLTIMATVDGGGIPTMTAANLARVGLERGL